MPKANIQARVPRRQCPTQEGRESTRVLRWTCSQQRGGSATQHGIQIAQHKQPHRGHRGFHPGQQDTHGRGTGPRTSQHHDHTGHGQLEFFTVGRGDRTPTRSTDELADAGLRRETGVRTVGGQQTR